MSVRQEPFGLFPRFPRLAKAGRWIYANHYTVSSNGDGVPLSGGGALDEQPEVGPLNVIEPGTVDLERHPL